MNRKRCLKLDYTKDFACDGTYCDACCCREWSITVDKAAEAKYSCLKDKYWKKEIRKNIIRISGKQERVFKLQPDLRCSFLDKDKLCRIQKNLGEGYLTDICAVYPRQYAAIGEFVCESLNLSCPVVGRMLMDRDKKIALIKATDEIKRPNCIQCAQIDKISDTVWYRLQSAGIEILQNRDLTIRQRLTNVLYFCEALQQLFADADGSMDAASLADMCMQDDSQKELGLAANHIKQMPNRFIKDYFTLYDNFMRKHEHELNVQYKPYRQWLLNYYKLSGEPTVGELVVLYERAEKAYNKYIVQRYPLFRENWLVNQWFAMRMPGVLEKRLAANCKLYVMCFRWLEMMLMVLAIHLQDKLTKRDIIDCISYISRFWEHEKVVAVICDDYIRDNNYELPDFMKIWLPNEMEADW